MDSSKNIEVTLTGLVYGGDAIGRLSDGRAVFVPFALPGETVRVSMAEEKRHHVLAHLEEILVPGELRVSPRCRHFGICGGCHYQHVPYSAQVDAKTSILVDQLRRIGKLTDIPLDPIVPSPMPWQYRNYIQFHISPGGGLGFSRLRSNEITPIVECFLPQSPIDAIWPLLNIEAGTGIQRVGLRLGSQEDIQIILESRSDTIPDFVVEDLDASVIHISDGHSVVLAGSEYVWMSIRERLFRISAGTFFQVNTQVAERMVEAILCELPNDRLGTILEVYCGAGLFSAFMAPYADHLIAIESSSSACDDFIYNLDEFDNVELYEALAESVIPEINIKPDIILVDPPRVGISRVVLQGIISLAAPKVVYISCDPATLARDARYMVEGGYVLQKVIPFDMFPQTYHIESISIWEYR